MHTSYQPPPHAKRQRLTFEGVAPGPILPIAPRQPHFDPDSPAAPSISRPADKSSHPSRSAHPPPVHGNYVGYYTKRRGDPGELDSRLSAVPPEWMRGRKVLDVGCNSGMVTVEIAQRFGPLRITGVDIDEGLVTLAKRHVELAWSRQAPVKRIIDAAGTSEVNSRDRPPHEKRPLVEPSGPAADTAVDPQYFPLALPRMFGYLPPPPVGYLTTYEEVPEVETVGVTRKGRRKVMPREVRAFPENVRFKAADWANESIESDRRGYDVIIALSVTKWIHLNHFNAGLFKFFSKCFKCLLPGGKLIIEAQPFSTYAKSARVSEELKSNYEKMRDGEGSERGWRNEEGDFERVLLQEIGFERMESLGDTGGRGGFRRPVDVYYKRDGSWV